ncbi:rod shape-determining protein MreD [Rhodophyticola sp. CCM32]|uniref:rod shape-determining protein MreD n=1 Tax=Rhodophyticola sp. CCM32 TaxID=2916397 RepID=UPI00107F88AA|nr:rod shape-determining protein MreD [Rhodophyticola sp. CCM32]QBY02481.1 rod shape-determining protein MreD [Rhodophyticola sp. CCM32]
MIDPVTRHIWTYRLLYLALSLVVIAYKLLPLSLGSIGLPSPDILLALTLAWLMRQPAVVPMGAIILVFLLADFLFQRPPGLWTLLVLLTSESLRRRRAQMTEFPFLVEWSAFAGAVFTLLILNRVALWVLMVNQTTLGLTLVHGIVTVAIYPVVVAVSKFLFGLRKLGPIDSDVAANP